MRDLTGKRFGKLTVLNIDTAVEYFTGKHGAKQKKNRWVCLCDCGNITKSFIQGLTSGRATQCKSCGYYRPQTSANMIKQLFHHLKHNAKRRNIPFNLNMTFLQKLFDKQDGRCAISHIQIAFASTRKEHKYGATTASLDRIDSERGYEPDNVQWVHKKINIMKNDMTQLDFVNWCRLVVEFQTTA